MIMRNSVILGFAAEKAYILGKCFKASSFYSALGGLLALFRNSFFIKALLAKEKEVDVFSGSLLLKRLFYSLEKAVKAFSSFFRNSLLFKELYGAKKALLSCPFQFIGIFFASFFSTQLVLYIMLSGKSSVSGIVFRLLLVLLSLFAYFKGSYLSKCFKQSYLYKALFRAP